MSPHSHPAQVHADIDRVEVMVNATQECNLACRYCFVDHGRFGYGEERTRTLSPHLIRKLVGVLPEKLPHAREFCIHFYGGEPLLNLPAQYVRGSSVVRKGWSLREAREYLKTLPVDAIKAQAVRLPPENELALNEKERLEYFEHLREAAAEAIECVRRGENPKDDRFNHRVLQLITGTKRKAFCGAGRRVFGMAADGTVLPCVLLAGKDGMVLGSIDDPYAKWVENGNIWAGEHGPRSECKACWALPLCGGGYRAVQAGISLPQDMTGSSIHASGLSGLHNT